MHADHLLHGLHIAVTRPADQAKSLCSAIKQHGGIAIEFPLLAVCALDDYRQFEQQISQLAKTDWAIFISSNAVDFAMPHVSKKYEQLPAQLKFAAIGQQTAAALGKHGIHNVLIPQGRFDSETLLALPEMQQVAGKTFAIFRGVGGRELMAETLKARGAQVYFAESYHRINPQKNTQQLHTLWKQHKLDAVIVTSSEAMRYLLQMAENESWLQHVTLCVNHERIAEQPRRLGLNVLVAESPGDEAMLQCLSQLAKSKRVNHHD